MIFFLLNAPCLAKIKRVLTEEELHARAYDQVIWIDAELKHKSLF